MTGGCVGGATVGAFTAGAAGFDDGASGVSFPHAANIRKTSNIFFMSGRMIIRCA